MHGFSFGFGCGTQACAGHVEQANGRSSAGGANRLRGKTNGDRKTRGTKSGEMHASSGFGRRWRRPAETRPAQRRRIVLALDDWIAEPRADYFRIGAVG